jgi:hypothetical protein
MTDLANATVEQLEAAIAAKKAKEGVAEKLIVFPLKMEQQHIFHMDEHDLDQWVRKVWGKDLEFVALQECSNDTSHEFTIYPPEKTALTNKDDENAEVEAFLYGPKKHIQGWGAHQLFQYLGEKGILPVGKYVVRVSW